MKKIIIAITTLVIMNSCKKNSISPAPQPQPISQATKILGKWEIISIHQEGINAETGDKDSTIYDLNKSSFAFKKDNNSYTLTTIFNKDLSTFLNSLVPSDLRDLDSPLFFSLGKQTYSASIDEEGSLLSLDNLDRFARENGKTSDIGLKILTLNDNTLVLHCGTIASHGNISYVGYWTITLHRTI